MNQPKITVPKKKKQKEMKNKILLNAILLEIKKLRQELVVVEGQHDESALLKLGFGNIFVLNRAGMNFPSRIEGIIKRLRKKKECIILTDFDKKGKALYGALKKGLMRERIKINDSLRNLLFKAGISHVEGLATFLRNHI